MRALRLEEFSTQDRTGTLLTKIDMDFAAAAGSDSFVVRLDEVESNNEIKAKLFTSSIRPTSELGTNQATHHFLFHNAAGEPGVILDRNIRLGVLLSRLGDDTATARFTPSTARSRPLHPPRPMTTQARISSLSTAWSTSTSTLGSGSLPTRTTTRFAET